VIKVISCELTRGQIVHVEMERTADGWGFKRLVEVMPPRLPITYTDGDRLPGVTAIEERLLRELEWKLPRPANMAPFWRQVDAATRKAPDARS
jgi:hypothetical protein